MDTLVLGESLAAQRCLKRFTAQLARCYHSVEDLFTRTVNTVQGSLLVQQTRGQLQGQHMCPQGSIFALAADCLTTRTAYTLYILSHRLCRSSHSIEGCPYLPKLQQPGTASDLSLCPRVQQSQCPEDRIGKSTAVSQQQHGYITLKCIVTHRELPVCRQWVTRRGAGGIYNNDYQDKLCGNRTRAFTCQLPQLTFTAGLSTVHSCKSSV